MTIIKLYLLDLPGTGILSMFAAQAGAKHVYAVDCSSIIDQARAIIKLNNFDDRITLIKGKIEEIELPVTKIDVLLSEWLGYCLLYESMLDSVLFARDKWLVPGGIVYPDKSVLYIAAIEDGQVKRERIDFWEDVYGFNMTPIKEIALKEPVVDVVDAKALVTDAVPVLTLDILTCTKKDLDFKNPFKLRAQVGVVFNDFFMNRLLNADLTNQLVFSNQSFLIKRHLFLSYLQRNDCRSSEWEKFLCRVQCGESCCSF